MDPADFLPLREPTYFILLSLASGQKHGYAILKDVEELSEGNVRLSTSTLYEGLARLQDQDLIERVREEPQTHPGKPRKAYQLTHSGRQVLQAETNRLKSLLAAARRTLPEDTV